MAAADCFCIWARRARLYHANLFLGLITRTLRNVVSACWYCFAFACAIPVLIRAAEFAADCADFADEDWLGDAWSGPPEPQPVTAKAATIAQANTGATRRSRSAATGLVGMRLISMEGCSAPDADSGGRLVLQGPC